MLDLLITYKHSLLTLGLFFLIVYAHNQNQQPTTPFSPPLRHSSIAARKKMCYSVTPFHSCGCYGTTRDSFDPTIGASRCIIAITQAGMSKGCDHTIDLGIATVNYPCRNCARAALQGMGTVENVSVVNIEDRRDSSSSSSSSSFLNPSSSRLAQLAERIRVVVQRSRPAKDCVRAAIEVVVEAEPRAVLTSAHTATTSGASIEDEKASVVVMDEISLSNIHWRTYDHERYSGDGEYVDDYSSQ